MKMCLRQPTRFFFNFHLSSTASEGCDKKAPLLINSFALLLMGGLAEEEEGETVQAVELESSTQAF